MSIDRESKGSTDRKLAGNSSLRPHERMLWRVSRDIGLATRELAS